MHTFIDIHSHHPKDEYETATFRLRNVIVSQDEIDGNPCSVGVHPWYIEQDGAEQLTALRGMLERYPTILAVGECGLDKLKGTTWGLQEAIFSAQLHAASEFSKPIIIHCVRAYQEVIKLVKESQNTQPIIMHGFYKSIELARQLLHQNFYLSLGESILRGRQDQLITEIPLHRLFLETDTSSISISEIYTYFCRVRNISVNTLQTQISANFEEVFN